MRLALALALVFALGFAGFAAADDAKKEMTFEGKITCGKCDLGKDKKCATVIVVKKDDKETVYYFDSASDKKYHKDICQGGKDGKVVGTTSEKDGKSWIKVTKLEYSK